MLSNLATADRKLWAQKAAAKCRSRRYKKRPKPQRHVKNCPQNSEILVLTFGCLAGKASAHCLFLAPLVSKV